MGMKDWFAGKIAGPQGYGDALGRQAREGGSALGNLVFISHGVGPDDGATVIFDSEVDMERAGFKPRFTQITELDLDSLTNEEQLLFKSLQTAMIAFTFTVNSNAASQNMSRDNTSKFRSGLVPSLTQAMVESGLFDSVETAKAEILSYITSLDSVRISTVFNMERPASGDVLEHFIIRAVKISGARFQYGFARTGLNGFDVVAVPLVKETLASIFGATKQYKW